MIKRQLPEDRCRADHNASQFNFADFTRENYRKILKQAKKSYEFSFFDEFATPGKRIIWRHDCDVSIHAARDLAVIEHEEGVRATYFLLLGCQFYNLFESQIRDLVSQIVDKGHRIGVHFDFSAYNIQNEADLEKWLYFEKNTIETLIPVKVEDFSFHNPTHFSKSFDKIEYAGMRNVYSSKVSESYHYCSDSNGYWRHERLPEIIDANKYQRLHILTHPEYWPQNIMSPKERIAYCVDGRGKNALENIERTFKASDRPFLDWSNPDNI